MSNTEWEVVQEKAFTAWVNGVLDRVGESITDISADFSDGIKLAHFLELLANKKFGKKLEERKQEIYRIQNLFLALQFAENEMGVKAEGVAAEDFVKGNRKLVLGFLWTLYRKYRIAIIKEGDKSSEEGLLQWCKNVTTDYGGVDIKSFKTGFRDGNAFLALAHSYDPSAFDYDAFKNESPETRLEKAFEIAEKSINIPKLLDAGEVMKGTADERSLILYTSLFFHAFSAKAQKDALNAEKQKLDNLEGSLASAAQNRDELLRQLGDLEKTRDSLSESNDQKDGKIRELTEENTTLKHEVAGLKENKTTLESELNSLGLKSKSESGDLSSQIESLKKKIEELESHIKELEEQITALKSRLDASEKLNEELKERITRLEEEKEAQKVKLEGELKDALTKLEEERKRADAEFSMLLLLRSQFDQHVLDMHRWRKLLEVDNIADFLSEVKLPLEDELAKQGGFEAQVKLLRGNLDNETKDIQKYLHDKEEFEKQRLKVDKKR